MHHRDTSGFTGKKLKSQEKRFLNRAHWDSKIRSRYVCGLLSIPRKKKEVPQPVEWGWRWLKYEILQPLTHICGHGQNLHSRSSGREAQRQGGSRKCHQPAKSSHSPAWGHSPQPWPAAPCPADSPFARGNPWQGSALVICWTKWSTKRWHLPCASGTLSTQGTDRSSCPSLIT